MPATLRLQCLIKGESIVFPVTVEQDDDVGELKEVVQSERALDSLKDVGPHTLELWKLKDCNSIAVEPDDTLVERIGLLGHDFSKFADKLGPTRIVSSIFPTQPPRDYIHIIVNPRTTNLTPSSSQNPNISQSLAPPRWLVELHRNLRTRTNPLNQIFRTANLTKHDFIELQHTLDKLNPERMSEFYVAKNVLATKSAFLLLKSTPLKLDVVDGLIPRLVFDTSQLPSEIVVNDDADADDDDDAVADDAMDSSSCHDMTDLSNEAKAVFPYIIRYLDLAGLELEEDLPVPQLMLFRNEWDSMIDIFNKRTNGIRGSAVFTGQPGIGKKCLLYSVLILCIIRRQQIVFQDIDGNAFIIDDTVRPLIDAPAVSKGVTDILALVDADAKSCQPNENLFKVRNLRILLTSSSTKKDDRKWLTHRVQDLHAMFIMKPWSREEFVVASLFLQNADITLKRLQKASYICGNIPRTCFQAAVSPALLRGAKDAITKAIKDSDLSSVTSNLQRGDPIHRAFQIRPSSEDRFWNGYIIGPVSDWAFSAILENMHQRNIDEAYKFYRAIQGHPDCSQLRGKMLKHIFTDS